MSMFHTIAALPVRPVALSKIRCLPGPFTLSYAFDLSPLVNSIRQIGLANAPLLIGSERGAYEIVIGFRRVHAACFLGWKEIPCRVLPATGSGPMECLLISLYDNLVTRTFNDVEKGMALNRLMEHVDDDQILSRFMPCLGLASLEETLRLYVSFDQRLDEGMKRQLATGVISRDSAKALLDMAGPAARMVSETIEKLKFNINDQKKFIDIIVDITKNNLDGIRDLISAKDFQEILSRPETNTPQRAAAALRLLKGKASPRLVAAEEAFRRGVGGLGLPKGARIEAPPFFEAPGYRLIVSFTDGKRLEETLKQVLETKDLGAFSDPWET